MYRHMGLLYHCILPLWKGSFSPSCATRTISRIFLQLISPESALIFPSTSLLSAEYKQYFRLKQTKEANDHPWFHLFSLATPPLPDSFVKAVPRFFIHAVALSNQLLIPKWQWNCFGQGQQHQWILVLQCSICSYCLHTLQHHLTEWTLNTLPFLGPTTQYCWLSPMSSTLFTSSIQCCACLRATFWTTPSFSISYCSTQCQC